jgi:hypothetical protein
LICRSLIAVNWHTKQAGAIMPTPEQCRTYAAEFKRLGLKGDSSVRRAAVLMCIAESWTTLAKQLDWLSAIMKEEGN